MLSDNHISGIILCIISLLQDVQIIDKKNKYIGELKFAIDKENITLLGRVNIGNVKAAFPVLVIKNTYLNFNPPKTPYTFNDTPLTFDYTIEIENVLRKLTLMVIKDGKSVPISPD